VWDAATGQRWRGIAVGRSERIGQCGASASPSGPAATPASSGTLRFANWIGYIDQSDDHKTFPTIEKFQTETGITTEYADGAVDDNETFFTSDLQAPLEAGQPTEWDLVVVTDWMVARLSGSSGSRRSTRA
jgi:spermidine/putrescine transport system substrate-binding protein